MIADPPRVSEASPAQLAAGLLAALGWAHGNWTVELVACDGEVRRVRATCTMGGRSLRRAPAKSHLSPAAPFGAREALTAEPATRA